MAVSSSRTRPWSWQQSNTLLWALAVAAARVRVRRCRLLASLDRIALLALETFELLIVDSAIVASSWVLCSPIEVFSESIVFCFESNSCSKRSIWSEADGWLASSDSAFSRSKRRMTSCLVVRSAWSDSTCRPSPGRGVRLAPACSRIVGRARAICSSPRREHLWAEAHSARSRLAVGQLACWLRRSRTSPSPKRWRNSAMLASTWVLSSSIACCFDSSSCSKRSIDSLLLRSTRWMASLS